MRRTVIVSAALVAIAGLIALAVAQQSSSTEVRVNARKLDDGRVEIGVQQLQDQGWGKVQLPSARYLKADAELGRWYSSSPATVTVAHRLATEAAEISFFCMVTHEQPGDEEFWNLVRTAAVRVEALVGIEVRVRTGVTATDQAQHIRECVDNGADGIAVTLPDPDGLIEAVSEARAAGVSVVSFNSGLNDFERVGSSRHHSVDEVDAGREAGARLNRHGVAGTLLCVIHEAANVGLVERCDGVAEAYAGEVERLSVAQSGVADLPASTAAIAARIRAEGKPKIAAIVTLNTQIGLAGRDAIAETGESVVLATFDQSNEVLQAISRGEILFAIDTLPFHQGWYALSQLINLVPGEERMRERFGVDDPSLIFGQFAARLQPRVFTMENATAWIRLNQGLAQDLGE